MARYEKGHKGETRRRIVELASKRFRMDGVDGVGVASLMAEAGLTNGGFYAHFASKEDLVKEAVVHALSARPGFAGETRGGGPADLHGFIQRYLSVEHRDDAASGCVMAAMSPELARRPAESRAAIEDEGLAMMSQIAAGLPPHVGSADRPARAMAVFAHVLGTLQMARFVRDPTQSEEILRRGRLEALRIAGFEPRD